LRWTLMQALAIAGGTGAKRMVLSTVPRTTAALRRSLPVTKSWFRLFGAGSPLGAP